LIVRKTKAAVGSPNPTCAANTTLATTSSGLFINYKAQPTNMVYSLASDCKTLGPTMTNVLGDQFAINCDRDLNVGPADETDSEGNSLPLVDILGIVAYALDDCLVSCSEYTIRSKQYGSTNRCGSVTFSPNISNHTYPKGYGTNCWLKNGTVKSLSTSSTFALGYISAVLS